MTAFSPVVIVSSGVLLLLESFLINLYHLRESSISSGFHEFINKIEHSALSFIIPSFCSKVWFSILYGCMPQFIHLEYGNNNSMSEH